MKSASLTSAGVTDEEALGSLPGDEFVVHPMVEWTRGVTVHAAPDRVWPWLVQSPNPYG